MGLLLATTGPAQAHITLVRTDPADGATVRTALRAVQLTFDEALQPPYSVVAVRGADGRAVGVGRAQITGKVLRQPVRLTAAGRYLVTYRVISADGHPVSGQVSFGYAPSPVAAPPSDASSSASGSAAPPHTSAPAVKPGAEGGGVPILGASVLAGGVVALGGVLFWLRRRRPA